MFDNGKVTYKSDIKLGDKYRDSHTEITGTATAIYFFEHACERVTLELVVDGELKDYTFDAMRLIDVETGEKAGSNRTGGPKRERNVRASGVGHR